jgi:hypothetical protein
MSRARVDKHGRTKEQALIQQNRILKRQVQSLRKQLARLDTDRIDIAREVIQEHYQNERAEEGREILENLKHIWKCNSCDEGFMEIFVFNRGADTIYYRICSQSPYCMNRTKSQIYDPKSVKGIMRKDKNES